MFTVVHEQVLTDTARYADVLLPATTFLEHSELRRGYGTMLAQLGQPAVEPVGEARPNYWLFAELCRRMGLSKEGEPETPDELLRAIVATSSESSRVLAELEVSGRAVPACGLRPVQFVDVFPRTPDQKIDLCPRPLDAEAPQGLYGYASDPATTSFPLSLISPSTSEAISSTLYGLVDRQVSVELHPADAAAQHRRRRRHSAVQCRWRRARSGPAF